MTQKIKIAFIKYGGLGAGGTERWLQELAVALNKNKFDVDYFYTGDENTDRLHFMQQNHIKLIKIKSIGKIPGGREWINTDLFEKFDESKYDIIQNAIAGEKEWPFYLLKKPLVESVHLDYGVNFTPNVYHTFLLSEWNRKKWCKMGGIRGMSSVVPLGCELPKSSKDLRRELKIPKNAIVSGFHQRVDDNIFSEIPIYAYKANEAPNHYFVIMGGSPKYAELAKKLKLKNFIQMEHCANKERLSMFLNTLDIFAHGRRDGETLGYVIIEALLHKKPCIVHKAPSNAQRETIGPGGIYAETQEQYNRHLATLLNDTDLRAKLATDGFNYAKQKFIDTDYVKGIENKYIDIVEHPIKYKVRIILFNFLRTLKHPIRKEKTPTHKIYTILGIKVKTKRNK